MRSIAVVDIETTGFQNQGGVIVEVGIVGLNLETGEITKELDLLVKEKDLTIKHTQGRFGWIFKNSDLKYDDIIKNGVDSNEAWTKIQRVIDKFEGVTAYNKSFDFGFLISRGIKIKELPCIMLTACPVVNLPPNYGYSTPKWPTVEESWKYFFPKIDYVEKHRALDDAVHEATICHVLFKLGAFKV